MYLFLFALLEQIKATDTVENRSITLSCLSTHCVDLCYINHFDWCNSSIARNEVCVETVEDCSPFYLRVLANAPQTLTAFQPLARKALSVRFSTNTLNDLRHFIGVDVTLSSAR